MNRESILLIDDDPGFLKIGSSILAKKGYDVSKANSAGEALANVSDKRYNMAILDISLPDMDGTELLLKLMQKVPELPVIMLTGHSSAQNAIKSLNNGAFAYLEKPVEPETLISVINRGMEKQRLILENNRLLRELEERNVETNTLLQISQHVSHSLDIPEIIKITLKLLSECLNLDACHIYLRENGSLKLKGNVGIVPPGELKNIKWDMIGTYIKDDAVLVFDFDKEKQPFAYLKEKGIPSYVLLPLVVKNEAVGFIGLASKKSFSNLSNEKEMLSGIGRAVAIAIKNAQLYEEASSAKALRELDALRTELLANVSHELRTPLSAIKGYSSALLQPDVSFDQETLREFLQTIDKEADKLNRLISDLLIMSRLDSGTLEVKKTKQNLATVVDNIRDNLFNLTTKHILNIDIPENLPEVTIDDKIGAVIINLVENAAKYSPEGTCITITAVLDDKYIVVTVKDEGAGVPEELKDKIFERFYQITDPQIGHKPGTGLGLSICQGIVEAHGGRIWVDSQIGKGSEFHFNIPVRK